MYLLIHLHVAELIENAGPWPGLVSGTQYLKIKHIELKIDLTEA
jgi:hypothetical protein